MKLVIYSIFDKISKEKREFEEKESFIKLKMQCESYKIKSAKCHFRIAKNLMYICSRNMQLTEIVWRENIDP